MPRTIDSDSKIRDLTERFVGELSVLVREAALEAVQDALEGAGGGATTRRRGTAKKATRRKTGRAARRAIGKRIRRSSADVDAFAADILSHVKANPGSGAGDLCDALGCATKDLRPPILKLLGEKKLRTEGQRRGTKYFAGGGGKRKATKKKTARRKTTKKKARRKTAKRKAA